MLVKEGSVQINCIYSPQSVAQADGIALLPLACLRLHTVNGKGTPSRPVRRYRALLVGSYGLRSG